MELSALIFGTHSCLTLCCYEDKNKKQKTDHNQLSGRKDLFQLLLYRPSTMEASARTQGRNLQTRTETEAEKECCSLACFPLLAQPAFFTTQGPGRKRDSILKVIYKRSSFCLKNYTRSRNMNATKTSKVSAIEYL